jgi:hypothetical protein
LIRPLLLKGRSFKDGLGKRERGVLMPSLRVRPFREVERPLLKENTRTAEREHEDDTRKERVGRDSIPKP